MLRNLESGKLYVSKTTIDVPEKALKDAMRYAKTETKRGAVLVALEDYNRRQQMAELIAFSGTCKELMTFDELMEVRERDLPEAAWFHPR